MSKNWVSIKGFESTYEISDTGKIRNIDMMAVLDDAFYPANADKPKVNMYKRGAIPVYCIELDRHYESVFDAAIQLGWDARRGIAKAIQSGSKYRGLTFEREELCK